MPRAVGFRVPGRASALVGKLPGVMVLCATSPPVLGVEESIDVVPVGLKLER